MGCIDNVSIPGEMDAAGAPTIAWNCMSQVLRQVSHARRVSRVDHAKRVAALEQVCVACSVADFVDVKMTDFALKPLHQHERAFVPPRQERTRCGRRAGTDGQCADTQRDAAQLEHAIDLSRDGPFVHRLSRFFQAAGQVFLASVARLPSRWHAHSENHAPAPEAAVVCRPVESAVAR